MIRVHQLNNSRALRIMWLLEELGLPYEIVKYQRGSPQPFAPPELKKVHPLGKSPVIEDSGMTIAESAAIVEYLIDTYGRGRFKPEYGTADYWRYIQWMHFAEGSAMLPLIRPRVMAPLGDSIARLKLVFDSAIGELLSYMDGALGANDFFVGNTLTGADIMLIVVTETAGERLADYKNLLRFRDAIHARPAYRRAVEKSGDRR
jgi:glutathione S-transferase